VAVLVLACTADGSSRAGRPGADGARSATPGPPRPIDRPNIVFVLTDDLSTDLVRYMPHVQALAQAGTSFRNYFVVDSLCCPSRASILTGQYPHNTQVFYNTGPRGGWAQFNKVGDNRKVFGLSLQATGYRTGFLGKYLNHYPPKAAPPPGWNEWDVTGSEGYNEFDYHLNENGHVHWYGHAPRDYLTDVLSNKATQFIDSASAAGQAFALEVATYAPHRPATPAPADRGSFATLHAPRGPE
jgi:arylsulfatase A-like enzyme